MVLICLPIVLKVVSNESFIDTEPPGRRGLRLLVNIVRQSSFKEKINVRLEVKWDSICARNLICSLLDRSKLSKWPFYCFTAFGEGEGKTIEKGQI